MHTLYNKPLDNQVIYYITMKMKARRETIIHRYVEAARKSRKKEETLASLQNTNRRSFSTRTSGYG